MEVNWLAMAGGGVEMLIVDRHINSSMLIRTETENYLLNSTRDTRDRFIQMSNLIWMCMKSASGRSVWWAHNSFPFPFFHSVYLIRPTTYVVHFSWIRTWHNHQTKGDRMRSMRDFWMKLIFLYVYFDGARSRAKNVFFLHVVLATAARTLNYFVFANRSAVGSWTTKDFFSIIFSYEISREHWVHQPPSPATPNIIYRIFFSSLQSLDEYFSYPTRAPRQPQPARVCRSRIHFFWIISNLIEYCARLFAVYWIFFFFLSFV